MPAFKKFEAGDQLDNVLIVQPQYDLVSGSSGWRGSPDGSASISLYGGARRTPAGVVRDISYQSLYPNAGQTGDPRRGLPMTASVQVVWLTNEEIGLDQRSSSRWGEEHWKTVQRLYNDYSAVDPDYMTGSYDYYCLYLNKDSRNVVNAPMYVGDSLFKATGSFVLEAWINPFMTASLTNDFTIQSLRKFFWWGITGSTGRLAFSSSLGLFSANSGPTPNRWSHVALAFNSASLTGTFYMDLQNVGTFTLSSSLPAVAVNCALGIGNILSGNSNITDFAENSGSLRKSFHGLMAENRVWGNLISFTQLSASHNRPLTVVEKTGTVGVFEFNDGPLRSFYWGGTLVGTGRFDGSGTINQAITGTYNLAELNGFRDRPGPVWLPNDNVRFYPDKTLVPLITSASFTRFDSNVPPIQRSADLTKMVIIDIPSAFYGREIGRNSVQLTCRAYSSGSYGLVRTLIDDGRGGLFVSGSMASGSTESYRGVEWNKVGNVFYGEGLIVIKDPSLFDFGRIDGVSSHPDDTLQLSFKGDSRIPVKTLSCRIDRGEFNATLNPTYRDEDEDDGVWERRFTSGTVRVTTVGLYNSDRELVGVARLADPVRIRARDRLNIRIRMDF